MNTLKIDVNTLEIGQNDKELNSYNNSRYFEFNESFKTSLVVEPTGDYRTIDFSQVTSPFLVVITGDKDLNIQVNNTAFTNTKLVVLNTSISSIQIANVDIQNANVNIYIWGVQ